MKAISYVRFSSGKQGKGSSVERQRALFDEWLKMHSTYEESDLSKIDRGVSGYDGSNLDQGRGLSDLLTAIRSGVVQRGDALVVEAIDRLGRTNFYKMAPIITEIVSAGVSIFTLEDGVEYTDKSGSSQVYVLVGKIQQAHEYSLRLGQRVAAAYERKRRDALQGKPVKVSRPFWLTSDGKIDPDAEKVVKEAIELYLRGRGTRDICHQISSKHPKLKKLNPRTLKRWFTSPALIGEWGNKGDPIPNVFEPLLTPSEFLHLQREVERKTIMPGPADKYDLSGMVFCAVCGAKFQTRRQYPASTKTAPHGSEAYKAKGVILYSNCKNYLQKKSCGNNATWPYEVLECIYRFSAIDALADIATGVALDTRSKELDDLHASVGVKQRAMDTQGKLYEASDDGKYLARMREIREEIDQLNQKISILQESISRQKKLDRGDLEGFEDRAEEISSLINGEMEKLTSRPSFEVASMLKRYGLRIEIEGKTATSKLDEIPDGVIYKLLRRRQQYMCYFVESQQDDDDPIYYAVPRYGKLVLSARSIPELEEKLVSRLDEGKPPVEPINSEI